MTAAESRSRASAVNAPARIAVFGIRPLKRSKVAAISGLQLRISVVPRETLFSSEQDRRAFLFFDVEVIVKTIGLIGGMNGQSAMDNEYGTFKSL